MCIWLLYLRPVLFNKCLQLKKETLLKKTELPVNGQLDSFNFDLYLSKQITQRHNLTLQIICIKIMSQAKSSDQYQKNLLFRFSHLSKYFNFIDKIFGNCFINSKVTVINVFYFTQSNCIIFTIK
jgi:hypothetical protein